MKGKCFILAAMIFGLTAAPAFAQKGLGLGVILGEPTGVSLKAWISENHAVDAAAAWSYSQNDSFQFHADYLFHEFGLIQAEEIPGKFPVYFGVGGRIKLERENNGRGRNDHHSLVGVRVPFGVSYLFPDVPVDLFFEVVPILNLAPDSQVDLNAAIGARFYIR